MVNTFLVRGNYLTSAQYLDYARLGKQRVEAAQILTFLEQLRFLAHEFGFPDFPKNVPTSIEQRTEWIRAIVTTFNKSWSGVIIRNNYIIWIPKGVTPYKISDDIYITTGFKSHPAVRAWLGYEESLKEYITAHIEEWERRGYNNTMRKYPVTNSIKPLWAVDNSEFVLSCKSKLLEKDPRWYSQFSDFRSTHSDYVWP